MFKQMSDVNLWLLYSYTLYHWTMCNQMSDVKLWLLYSYTLYHWTMCKQMSDVKLWLLYSYTWNNLTVCKQMPDVKLCSIPILETVSKKMSTDLFKNFYQRKYVYKLYI